MSKYKIPTIIVIILLVVGVAAGIVLIQARQIFKLGASPDTTPKDVKTSNITDSSFTVTWITDKETVGYVSWGKDKTLGNTTAVTETQASKIHASTVRNLQHNSLYYFKINSEKNVFDNNGIPWETQTGSTLTPSTGSMVASGTIISALGEPVAQALVHISAGGMSPISTITSDNGSWLIPLSSSRTTNLTSYLAVSAKTPLLNIFVQSPNGIATAQIYPDAANPTPAIIIGQNHDFKNETPAGESQLPKSSLTLPKESTPSSGFEVSEVATSSSETVTLESPEKDEIITTTTPEFFGEGPPGTLITITIESDPVTDNITIDNYGNWDWSPPDNLEEGKHTITIKWKDAAGILRILSRTFIVQAAEGPAFESTPSASPTASPSATATPTATLRVSLPSTQSAIPQSGILTPTIWLSIMGLGLITVSFIVWKVQKYAS
jgi:hypothetical protein